MYKLSYIYIYIYIFTHVIFLCFIMIYVYMLLFFGIIYNLKPNRIRWIWTRITKFSFCSKLNVIGEWWQFSECRLSSRSYSIQFEREWEISFPLCRKRFQSMEKKLLKKTFMRKLRRSKIMTGKKPSEKILQKMLQLNG